MGLSPPVSRSNKTHWILDIMKQENQIENRSFSVFLGE